MKKILVVLSFVALFLGLSSCNKYCVCTVTKNGETLQEYDFSDLELNRNECLSKTDVVMDNLISAGATSDLVGVSVDCSHM